MCTPKNVLDKGYTTHDLSAIIFRMVESAKANHLKTFDYLFWLLESLPNVDMADVKVLDAFLPWSHSCNFPQNCRVAL